MIEYITSKNLFLLIRDTLKLIDRRLMDHGSRVSYIMYKMLQCKGGYEPFELADIVLLATLHDIGAYKTDDIGDMLRFETRDYLQHSVYGFLFIKYLSPLEEKAKILLYHHMDYKQIENLDYQYKDVAACLNLAEKVDTYNKALGDQFDYTMFNRFSGVRFSEEALTLLDQAVAQYDIFEKIKTEDYQRELDELLNFILFSNEEKKKYLEMLMYCIGLRGEYSVVDKVTSICIAQEIGKKLGIGGEDMEKLYYGALIHDIGMLSIPQKIISADRKLTPEEMTLVRSHVMVEEKILNNRLHPEVVKVAVAHHERCDGSGYPKGLKEADMNQLQKILQVADTITALTNNRVYREKLSKEQVIDILGEEVKKNQFDKEIVGLYINYYDTIMNIVSNKSTEILTMHTKLEKNYELVCSKFKK